MDNIAVSGNFEITPCEQIADIESNTTASVSNGNRGFEQCLYFEIAGGYIRGSYAL